MAHVLILFQADTEATEQLALAVAVGAVEAEASIRLRRLTLPGSPELGHHGYGQLQPADLAWADTIALLLESSRPESPDPESLNPESPNPTELTPLLDLLRTAPPTTTPKHVTLLHTPTHPLLLLEAFQTAGFTSFDPDVDLLQAAPSRVSLTAGDLPNDLLAAMKQAGRRAASATATR
jgi:hypothetical protein